jgi:hypothetical protein
VFDKKYPLLPLKDVGTFIEKNGHLPNIPTAEEIRVNGLNVAEMDKKLLEKIEELTLYILQQQKTIDDQREKLKTQDNRFDEQNKRMDALQKQLDALMLLIKK